MTPEPAPEAEVESAFDSHSWNTTVGLGGGASGKFGGRRGGQAALGTEDYAEIENNGFVAVDQQPLSTFSIDVDTASYAKTRMYLMQHRRMPRPDAVRIEELVNYLQDRGIHPSDRSALEKLELPSSLHSLILSRMDQLTEHQQSTQGERGVVRIAVTFTPGESAILSLLAD